MAFNLNDRVRVTSKNHETRGKSGTVIVPAAASADGFNKIRLDGFPSSKLFNLADNELGVTNFPATVQY